MEEESICKYFSGMPWIAVPFTDRATRGHLMELFAINFEEIPDLVVLDKNGEVANADQGVLAVKKYGSEAYPFTQERIDSIRTNLEDAKRNQTLRSLLVSSSRDFLISNNGNKVPASDLEGKIVALYFSDFSSSSNRFTSKLVKMYKKLKDRGENFEVVLVPLDDDESSFQLRFATVPWLAIPFKDKSCGRLGRYFELEDIPMLAVIGFDGKTLVPNAVKLVEKHGDEAYPFSLQKMEELAEKEKARMESQNLESLLVSWDGDYVIRNDDVKVKVRDLKGKVTGLYFSTSWGGSCNLFTPKLIEAYDELSQNHSNFEVVFATVFEMEEESFCKYFSGMPWIAVPFTDRATRGHLIEIFAINFEEIPDLVVLDKNGEVANAEGVLAVKKYGSEAYPFTQERIDSIRTNLEDAKRNQTLRSVLISSSRDFLISNNGNKVPVSDLEGKIAGLYFSDFSFSSNSFNSKLVKMYKKLKDRGENFEVVLVPLDDDESSFQLRFATAPWLVIPFKDRSCGRLGRYFELENIPMLAVIGFDGKTLVPDAVELVEKHGDEAYPFSLQKTEELAEKEKARMESQNIESFLVSWDGDYVIRNDDVKWPASSFNTQEKACLPITGPIAADFEIHGTWPANYESSSPRYCDKADRYKPYEGVETTRKDVLSGQYELKVQNLSEIKSVFEVLELVEDVCTTCPMFPPLVFQ